MKGWRARGGGSGRSDSPSRGAGGLGQRRVKVLLTGAGGVLGSSFADALAGQAVTTAGREALEVRRVAAVQALVAQSGADVVINCAAHTDAEAAEADPDTAFAANSLLPGLLGSACRKTGALLVQVSSTGCYGDWKTEPYTEEDPVRPTTTHHRSKVSGEAAVRDSGCEHLIVRTGWLYGGAQQPKNFVWRRLLEARGTARMTSDASQRGNPTFAGDVADQVLAMVEAGLRGTFNVVGKGAATRFEYVTAIIEAAGLPCVVSPGPAFKRLAPVSPNETALNYRLGLLGLDRMPHWRRSLAGYVDRLTASAEWRSLGGDPQ